MISTNINPFPHCQTHATCQCPRLLQWGRVARRKFSSVSANPLQNAFSAVRMPATVATLRMSLIISYSVLSDRLASGIWLEPMHNKYERAKILVSFGKHVAKRRVHKLAHQKLRHNRKSWIRRENPREQLASYLTLFAHLHSFVHAAGRVASG